MEKERTKTNCAAPFQESVSPNLENESYDRKTKSTCTILKKINTILKKRKYNNMTTIELKNMKNTALCSADYVLLRNGIKTKLLTKSFFKLKFGTWTPPLHV